MITLTKRNTKYDFNYQHQEEDSKNKLTLLDRNHSHFILVQNPGSGIEFGGEIDFRNRLENELSIQNNKEDKGIFDMRFQLLCVRL